MSQDLAGRLHGLGEDRVEVIFFTANMLMECMILRFSLRLNLFPVAKTGL